MARAMKNSGIDWIGEIPQEWKVERNKNAFKCSKEIVGADWEQTQLLSLTTKGIKEKGFDDISGKVPESFETYQTVEPNDLVMCLFDLDVSAVFSGISPFYGMISPAYKVLTCNSNIIPKYADYWFSYVFNGRKFKTYAKNLRYTLNYDEFAVLPIIMPMLEEQQRIADFLDEKCKEIDSVIAETEATIEEYKALKQSIITEAVTKGIRGERLMKDSGVEWIGEIPEEWKVKRVKYFSNGLYKGNGITKDEVLEDGDTPCVRYGEIYTKYNDFFNACASRTNCSNISNPQYFSYGDLLFACTGELVEEIGKNIVYLGNELCLAGGDIIVLKHSNNPLFFSYLLNSSYSQMQKSRNKTKLKVVHISASEIANIIVAMPPIDEQDEIAQFIKSKIENINQMINEKQQLIFEMGMFKKSLIYEYVTGKKEAI